MWEPPLDPFITSLANWEHVGYIRMAYKIMFGVGALAFIYFWFAAAGVIFSGVKDSWKRKRSLLALNDPENPTAKSFSKAVLKAMLVWLIAGWPLIFVITGLVSTDALNVLLGYDAMSGG